MSYHLVIISEILFALLNANASTINTRLTILSYFRFDNELVPLKPANLCKTVLHNQILSGSEIQDLVELLSVKVLALLPYSGKQLTDNQIVNLLNVVDGGYLPAYLVNLHTLWWSWHRAFNVSKRACVLFENRDFRASGYFSLLRLVFDSKINDIRLVYLAYPSDRLLPFDKIAMRYALKKLDANISDDEFYEIVNIAHSEKLRITELVNLAKPRLKSKSPEIILHSLDFLGWLGPIADGCSKEVEQLLYHDEPSISKAARLVLMKIALKD
jgi:hypothetical protein